MTPQTSTSTIRKPSDYAPLQAALEKLARINAKRSEIDTRGNLLRARLAAPEAVDVAGAADAILDGQHAALGDVTPLQAEEAKLRADAEVLKRVLPARLRQTPEPTNGSRAPS